MKEGTSQWERGKRIVTPKGQRPSTTVGQEPSTPASMDDGPARMTEPAPGKEQIGVKEEVYR